MKSPTKTYDGLQSAYGSEDDSESAISKFELYNFIWDGIDDMLPLFDEEVAKVLFSQTGCPLNGDAVLHFERHKSLSMKTLMFFYKKPTPCLIKASYRSKFPEHQHNNNYVVLDLQNLTWYQGCHDAECIRKSMKVHKKGQQLTKVQESLLKRSLALDDSTLCDMAEEGWISKGKSQTFAIYPSQSPLLFNSVLCIWKRIREWKTRFFVNAAKMSEFDGEREDTGGDCNGMNIDYDDKALKQTKSEKLECTISRRPPVLQPLPKKAKITIDDLRPINGNNCISSSYIGGSTLKKITTTTTTTTTTTIKTTTTTATKSIANSKGEDDTVNTLPNLDFYAAFFRDGFK
jgi:hypothetical protein